ncbi:hypothetical protein G6F32_015113 [Rhizopus arrhizus]|nr:hypothetical protein G6F32_015113 [Rhizopus arrhizus]
MRRPARPRVPPLQDRVRLQQCDPGRFARGLLSVAHAHDCARGDLRFRARIRQGRAAYGRRRPAVADRQAAYPGDRRRAELRPEAGRRDIVRGTGAPAAACGGQRTASAFAADRGDAGGPGPPAHGVAGPAFEP